MNLLWSFGRVFLLFAGHFFTLHFFAVAYFLSPFGCGFGRIGYRHGFILNIFPVGRVAKIVGTIQAKSIVGSTVAAVGNAFGLGLALCAGH